MDTVYVILYDSSDPFTDEEDVETIDIYFTTLESAEKYAKEHMGSRSYVIRELKQYKGEQNENN